MKKFIGLSLLLVSAAAFVPSVEAKSVGSELTATVTANTTLAPQYRQNRRRAVRTYTRNVRQGRVVYRETYRVVYRPNGTTRTQLVSRVRVGRY